MSSNIRNGISLLKWTISVYLSDKEVLAIKSFITLITPLPPAKLSNACQTNIHFISFHFHLFLINSFCTFLHPTLHSPLLLLHWRNLITLNHCVKLFFRLIFHTANVVHRQSIPFVHLADQLAHRARENLDLLRSDDVLDYGLHSEILEAAR